MKWIVSLALVLAWSLSVHAQGTCGIQLGGAAAFCDTFDTAQNGGTRSGDLNSTIWGVSRASGLTNPSQQQLNQWAAAHLVRCDGTSPVSLPPGDVVNCNGQIREATNDNVNGGFEAGNVTVLAMYPKQPFDFAGRTGTIAFDVSNDTHSVHAAWPELWVTDSPNPAPFSFGGSWIAHPANGFGIRFNAEAQPGQGGECPNTNNLGVMRWTIDSAVVVRNYLYEDTFGPFGTLSGVQVQRVDCVISPPAIGSGTALLNHVEVRVSQGQLDVYAADAGVPSSLRLIAHVLNVNLSFSRGLVWLEDAHYNADKGDAPSQRDHTFAWDNVAFDGPFTYQDVSLDALDALTPGPNGSVNLGKYADAGQVSTWNVLNVPAIPSADAVRVLFNFYHFFPFGTLTATVNGHAHPISWPYPETNGFTWRTHAIVIPLTDLVVGTNVVTLGGDTQMVFSNINLVAVNAGMGPPPDNTPPTVAVTSPVNGGSIQAGNQVSFTANASDASGIASVQFLDGTTSLGVDTTAPYGVTWNTTGLSGSHTLKAIATDGSNHANTAFSTVTVTITTPPPMCTTLQASTITWTGTGIAFNPPQTVTVCP